MKGDRRLRIRKGLNDLYIPAYDALCANLSEEWQPYFGLRTFEQQDAIYAQGRTKPGMIVTNVPGPESPHPYGCASDWTIFDENDKPIWLDTKDSRWSEYEMACEKAGVKWGGHFRSIVDFFHNELSLNISWHEIGKIYEDQGLGAALQKIAQSKI